MVIQEIMRRPVRTVGPETGLEAARLVMEMYGVRHLAVVSEEEGLVGVLSDRDLGGRHAAELGLQGRVRDRMNAEVITATPDMTVQEVANLLRDHKIGCLPVTQAGRLVGIVTETDLLEVLGR